MVAEERRRRTCLAKTIVDNSRKIKQHPRYAHAAAAAATLQEEEYTLFDVSGWQASYGGRHNGPYGVQTRREPSQGTEKHHKARRRRDPWPESDLGRSEVLPSEVEDGYRRWTTREVRFCAGTKRNTPADWISRPRKRPSSNTASHYDYKSKPIQPESRAQIKLSISKDIQLGKQQEAFAKLCRFQKEKDTLLAEAAPLNEVASLPNTSHALDNEAMSLGNDPIPGNDISAGADTVAAVSAFLALYKVKRRRKPVQEGAAGLATHLLNEAAQGGLLDEAQRMSMWLLDRQLFTQEHLQYISENVDKLATGDDLQQLRNLYKSTLLHPNVDGLDELTLLHCRLGLMVQLIKVSIPFDPLSTDPGIGRSLARALAQHDLTGQVRQHWLSMSQSHGNSHTVRLFLRCTRSMAPAGQSREAEARDGLILIAQDLLDLCFKDRSLQLAEKLLSWLSQENCPVNDGIIKLMEICTEQGNNGLLTTLFEKWCRRISIPPHLFSAVINVLTTTTDPKRAVMVMRNMPMPDRNADLTACPPLWTRLLDRQWKETNNFLGTRGIFDDMRRLAGDRGVGIALYNSMIRICVLAGHAEEAQTLIRQMQDRDGLEPDYYTMGHVVLASATSKDWVPTESLLAIMAEEQTSQIVDRGRIITPLLLEHARQHMVEETLDFAAKTMERISLCATPSIFNIVLKHLIHCKELESITRWINIVRATGLNIVIGSDQAIDAIKQFQYDSKPTGNVLSRLIDGLETRASQLASKELLYLVRNAYGQDLRSTSGHRHLARARRRAQHALARIDRRLKQDTLVKTYFVDDKTTKGAMLNVNNLQLNEKNQPLTKVETKQVHEEHAKAKSDMLQALTLGRPADAIEVYKKTLPASGIPQSSVCLDIAVEASLRNNAGNLTEALEIVKSAETAGMNVTSTLLPILVHHLQRLDYRARQNSGELSKTVTRFYKEMDAKNIRTSHHVGVTAASILMQKSPSEGIRLLRRIYFTSWAARQPLDIVGMTAYLHGYIALAHTKGIHWVVNQVLAKGIRIDRKFMSEFDRAKIVMRPLLERPGTKRERIRQFLIEFDVLRAKCLRRRAEQVAETTRFGEQLVETLIACSGRRTFDASARVVARSDQEDTPEGRPKRFGSIVEPPSPGIVTVAENSGRRLPIRRMRLHRVRPVSSSQKIIPTRGLRISKHLVGHNDERQGQDVVGAEVVDEAYWSQEDGELDDIQSATENDIEKSMGKAARGAVTEEERE